MASNELTTRNAYKSRRIRPGLYVTLNGRYRETRLFERSGKQPPEWLLERGTFDRSTGEAFGPVERIGQFTNSDRAFQYAAALDGKAPFPSESPQ